jgi:hypothetical protein
MARLVGWYDLAREKQENEIQLFLSDKSEKKQVRKALRALI